MSKRQPKEERSGEVTQLCPPEKLVENLSRFREVLGRFDRIALGGGPEAGKTTAFAVLAESHRVVHTDDWMEGGLYHRAGMTWDDQPRFIAAHCLPLKRVVLEGVRVIGCIRAGWRPDALVWLTQPLVALTRRQETMRQGRETDLGKFLFESHRVGLEVIRL